MSQSRQSAATWIAFGSIVKRTLTTTTPIRSSPLSSQCKLPHHQSLTSTSRNPARKIPRNHFTSNRVVRQENKTVNESEKSTSKALPKRNAASKRATSNSLRKVAIEAQRSRGLIKKSGKTRYVNPEADTKDVTGYCAAETYNLSTARHALQREGYETDPLKTGLRAQVLHAQTPNFVVKDDESGEERPQGVGDVFVFPSGCVVTWNVPQKVAHTIVERVLVTAAGSDSHPDKMEIEDLEYIEDPSRETSKILGETIILGTKPSDHHSPDTTTLEDDFYNRSPEIDNILAKIAFSSALARSTKLAVLENALSHYLDTTQHIPKVLARGKALRINRRQILQRTGELLEIRSQLNLYSEITDSLPDLFWDSPHELGLEGYYEMVGRALDVGVRIKVLNEKMDYASEIAAVLRERLSEKHSSMLEWMIIGLICIEVGFGVVHLWRESEALEDKDDERRTRELFEVWLERELKKGN
ncbi:hypothetical protein M409DRAFT_19471 [Zasmidium cellare ATCC 36951]|uniref:DUF155 domain-containing protein n=1 Tax=Zasmidium cellare ATCC 36951 TaxID=1080233 RepID=A0A6A6CZ63_ZASCE|nr:uncharacterized protein M409DRAFT_19471 [Zasmidium cellare ATCC 36951]KAF2170656.1 hypothetical protein M409DRAFT_19471 [Zasmidium cellare ATCC 36951]